LVTLSPRCAVFRWRPPTFSLLSFPLVSQLPTTRFVGLFGGPHYLCVLVMFHLGNSFSPSDQFPTSFLGNSVGFFRLFLISPRPPLRLFPDAHRPWIQPPHTPSPFLPPVNPHRDLVITSLDSSPDFPPDPSLSPFFSFQLQISLPF